MNDRSDTRQRLVELRHQLVADLGCQVDGGTLALLGNVQGALVAIDALPGSDEVAPADRVVIADDGERITLTLYREAEAVAVVLDPARAIRLAGELTAAVARRLGSFGSAPAPDRHEPSERRDGRAE